jgi:hypothetical protein
MQFMPQCGSPTHCQTLSGFAFGTVVPTKEGSFRSLSGVLKVYVKAGHSGNRREQTFCPNCGTSIYSGQMVPTDQYRHRRDARSQPGSRSLYCLPTAIGQFALPIWSANSFKRRQ